MRLYQSHFLGLCFEVDLPKLKGLITGGRDKEGAIGAELKIVDLVLCECGVTLCPSSLLGGTCLVRSQRRMTLSMPAEATYLQVGCRSSDIMDSLWPLRVRIRQGSYSLFICI